MGPSATDTSGGGTLPSAQQLRLHPYFRTPPRIANISLPTFDGLALLQDIRSAQICSRRLVLNLASLRALSAKSHLDSGDAKKLMGIAKELLHYAGSWNASDPLPRRARDMAYQFARKFLVIDG